MMARHLNPNQQKITEKMIILNDRGVDILTRIYNIQKACGDTKSKPGFLSDKSLESSIKFIVKRFPNIDVKGLTAITNIKAEVIKSLSLYYYTFVDLLDFKDHVCELLTTMDASQIHLDLTINFELTRNYLDLVITYVSLMILLSRAEDRKAVLGLFNAAYEMQNNSSDASFPRLGQMIIEYDVPIKKLSEEFIPHQRLLSAALISLGNNNNSNKPTQSSLAPRFVTRGHTYRAVVGDTLTLPCEVENLGSFVLLWRRGTNVLTASNIMVTRDERVRLIDGYNLEITELEPQDAGDYVCQISDKINRDQVHTVEILVPPSIRAVPTSGQSTARKGGSVTLECKASGNPVPSIHWTKKSGSGSSTTSAPTRIGEGPILSLERVDRQHAGVYQCTADNGVGEPVSLDMRLDVLYPPDIAVEKSWVHSGEGFEAQLVCIVHADPQPTVSWFQNSFPIQPTDRRVMSSRGNKHTLSIRHVQSEDFGNYSCVADNSLGRAKKYMEVSGRPGPAEFISPPWSRFVDSYNMTWKVMSYPPLQEVRLLYRKLLMNDTFQQPGRWHDVILTPSPRTSPEPSEHIMSFHLRGLQPSSVYEGIVQAKNRYGWNEVSDIFQFYTQRSSNEHRVEDMELVASSTSRSRGSSVVKKMISHHPILLGLVALLLTVSQGGV